MENNLSNIELWEKVKETDPKFTKAFTKGGGFSGTAVSPTYTIRRATEIFGPIGKGWGYSIDKEQMLEGHPISKDCKALIHCVQVSVWYMLDGERYVVPPQFGQTTFVGSNKYGAFTDEEAPKKSVTDAITKCLALLGFSADIFLGQYDDNKYVNDMNEKYGNNHKPPASTQSTPQATNPPSVSDAALIDKIKAFKLTEKQGSFVNSVDAGVKKYGKATDKQRAALQKILDSVAKTDEPPAYLDEHPPFNDEIGF